MNKEALPQANINLDVRGLNCPLPILRTRAQLSEMKQGDIINVIATDPLAPLDFKAYCARTDNELLDLNQEGDEISFLIKKG